ncbi:lipase family protein [Rhodotorula paludigena]|uniref:lipase family protein n=1 Tax=Rhodotorula paludigena TaxID=86838 RepID=UPI00317A798F
MSTPAAAHLADVIRVCKKRPRGVRGWFSYWSKRSFVVAFGAYLLRGLREYARTLLLSPATIFSDPLSTLLTLLAFPAAALALALLMLFFWLAGILGGRQIVNWISRHYANGLSTANWPNPNIFGSASNAAVQSARDILSGETDTTIVQEASLDDDNPDFSQLRTTRLFSLPLARALLLMSSLIYERDDFLVEDAARIVLNAQDKYEEDSNEYNAQVAQAEALLQQSERPIQLQATRWDLSADVVSELASIGGPCAAIFYTPIDSGAAPFIVLVLKGTTPTRPQEFLTDATFTKTGAGVFFGAGSGKVHEGFYEHLFMRNDWNDNGGDGYGSIVRTLRHVAQRMKAGAGSAQADTKIPLWVTGHSLGAALASLMYARFLHSEEDLGPNLDLRDCYAFACPRVGDSNFATSFEESLIKPLDRKNILWRIRNHRDIIASVPPGFADQESLRNSLSSTSFLNYAFLGPAIRIRPKRIPYRAPYYTVEQGGAFHEATEVVVAGAEGDAGAGRMQGQVGRAAAGGNDFAQLAQESGRVRAATAGDEWSVLAAIIALAPSFIYNHAPASYMAHLDNVVSSSDMATLERAAAAQQQRPLQPLATGVRRLAGAVAGETSARVRQVRREVQA